MDNQLRQAGAQATELLKTLMALPHPWNKNFYMFVRPLRGLVAKLEELS